MLAGAVIFKLQYVDSDRIAASLLLQRAGPSLFFVAAAGSIDIKIITHVVAAIGDFTRERILLAYFDLFVLNGLLLDILLFALRRFVVVQYFLYFLRVSPD